MRNGQAIVMAVVVLAVFGSVATAIGPEGIVVDTDRSVNCATLRTIVADVTRGLRTDQERAIAIYNFMVRTVYMPYHSHQPLEMTPRGDLAFVNDPLKYINVYGCCGCGPQAGVFCALLEAAGLEARILYPGFGHISSEVKWGGKWHWMDVWLPAYILDRNGEILSYDELMADRSLVATAKAEGRVPGNFMVNYEADLPTILHAKGHRPGPRDPYRQGYVENLALRPGESCTWLWGNVGKWFWPSGPWKAFKTLYLPGQFPCGPACKFTNDEVLRDAFGYWEPYKKIIKDGPHPWRDEYYRYYGNAIFVHEPALTRRGLAAVEAETTNLVFVEGGGLKLAKPPYGLVEIPFRLPYVIADTQIEGTAEMGVGGALSLCYSVDGGRTWILGDEVKHAGTFGPISIGKPNTYEYPAGSTSGQYGFLLRIVLRCNSPKTPTILKSLKITNTTMLNFYSRPWLEVGRNVITVTVKNPEALAKAPLEITWRWLEDWEKECSFTHEVRKSGDQVIIEVNGRKRPKMKSVTICCPAVAPGRRPAQN